MISITNKGKAVALPIVEKALEKEMDRKQFLMHAGAGLLTVVGAGGILKSLTGAEKHHSRSSAGYGSSAYGGGGSSLTKR